MQVMAKWCLAWMALAAAAPALAGDKAGAVAPADRYARRCQGHSPSRFIVQQGTMLWGTWSGWTEKERTKADDRKSVLVSASLDALPLAPQGVKSLRLEGGRLAGGQSVKGSVLQGMGSDGQPVEVAICDEQPAPGDPEITRYRIEAWNPLAQEWENPCVPTGDVPEPRALALGGVWDTSGAHHEVAGKITFACETGVASKCVGWGYKPWGTGPDGRSLADAHQACTRMARADYCGDGRSHTREQSTIEYYDSFGLSTRATKEVAGWDPARASFEAAWTPDGASCIARTRHGEPLSAILQECPGRFTQSAVDLGGGDRCAITQVDGRSAPAAVLRNRINGR